MPGILGRKIGMTRLIDDAGTVVPVTVVECQPNVITQVKTTEKDGYTASVLGFEQLEKPKKTKKFRHLAEFSVAGAAGDAITVASFEGVTHVRITAESKGKGFAGVIKRHNFSRGRETHGSHHHRQPGSSAGARSGTGRTPKGKRFPGHMGTDQVTIRSTPLMKIDTERHLLVIKGPIPGAAGGLVKIIAHA